MAIEIDQSNVSVVDTETNVPAPLDDKNSQGVGMSSKLKLAIFEDRVKLIQACELYGINAFEKKIVTISDLEEEIFNFKKEKLDKIIRDNIIEIKGKPYIPYETKMAIASSLGIRWANNGQRVEDVYDEHTGKLVGWKYLATAIRLNEETVSQEAFVGVEERGERFAKISKVQTRAKSKVCQDIIAPLLPVLKIYSTDPDEINDNTPYNRQNNTTQAPSNIKPAKRVLTPAEKQAKFFKDVDDYENLLSSKYHQSMINDVSFSFEDIDNVYTAIGEINKVRSQRELAINQSKPVEGYNDKLSDLCREWLGKKGLRKTIFNELKEYHTEGKGKQNK